MYISGIADQPGNIARDQAADGRLTKYPGIKLLATANGNWDQAAAQQKMTDLLGSFPNIDGVLTQDGMTLGILRAFDAAGSKIPAVTGETQVAFIKEWKRAQGRQRVLHLRRGKLPGRGLHEPRNRPPPAPGQEAESRRPYCRHRERAHRGPSGPILLCVDNTNIDKIYAKYKDTGGFLLREYLVLRSPDRRPVPVEST